MTEAYAEKLYDLRSHILDKARLEGQILLEQQSLHGAFA